MTLLERQFPGVMVLSPEDVATSLGFSRKSICGQIASTKAKRGRPKNGQK